MLGFRAFFYYKYKFHMNISLTIYFLLLGGIKYQIYIFENEKQLQKYKKYKNMKKIINIEIPRSHIQSIYFRYL